MPRLIDADALEAYIKDYACIPCKEYGADKDGIRCDFVDSVFALKALNGTRHTMPSLCGAETANTILQTDAMNAN